ncbi:hypothetical protein PVAP13_1NG467438 [Panicum virgatum]|nr:hypothetical protein PVAP13_1NG467438 [Panicum virgatum]
MLPPHRARRWRTATAPPGCGVAPNACPGGTSAPPQRDHGRPWCPPPPPPPRPIQPTRGIYIDDSASLRYAAVRRSSSTQCSSSLQDATVAEPTSRPRRCTSQDESPSTASTSRTSPGSRDSSRWPM